MSMTFTDRLYIETKHSHMQVDKHPFVSMIRTNKLAGEMYINLNKICIREMQTVLQLNDAQLYSNLYRDIGILEIDTTQTLDELLHHCREHPLESAYQFYLGLLFGGNMLKRMLPDHNDFLTYENSKQLITDVKKYLCDNVRISDQDIFINNVNKAYVLIKRVFDEFYVRLNNKV